MHLLIRGIKGKINDKSEITDHKTRVDLIKLCEAYTALVKQARLAQ